MSLNIKNEETCRSPENSPGWTGEDHDRRHYRCSAERLAREKHRRDLDARTQELHAIGQRCAKLMGEGASSLEHGDLLYDERGLPK